MSVRPSFSVEAVKVKGGKVARWKGTGEKKRSEKRQRSEKRTRHSLG